MERRKSERMWNLVMILFDLDWHLQLPEICSNLELKKIGIMASHGIKFTILAIQESFYDFLIMLSPRLIIRYTSHHFIINWINAKIANRRITLDYDLFQCHFLLIASPPMASGWLNISPSTYLSNQRIRIPILLVESNTKHVLSHKIALNHLHYSSISHSWCTENGSSSLIL